MARANSNLIIVSPPNPRGYIEEVVVSGTPKPGTFMEILPATADAQGAFTYRAASRTSGSKGPIAVLLGDSIGGHIEVGASLGTNLGHAPGDAYVSLRRGRIYWPLPGDELNAIVLSVAGTADDVAIGDLFGIESSAGKLKANASYASAPFYALEVITDPTADYLMHVKVLGGLA